MSFLGVSSRLAKPIIQSPYDNTQGDEGKIELKTKSEHQDGVYALYCATGGFCTGKVPDSALVLLFSSRLVVEKGTRSDGRMRVTSGELSFLQGIEVHIHGTFVNPTPPPGFSHTKMSEARNFHVVVLCKDGDET
ncbi:predicted protein [Histoplasma mississippiense (nom. inval.)]|uniref:predicted protein n=1 Tax=Ajellomyces capsulatus (strain NAm1 / WU24) TaxID=2059318 RepID=UPI000157C22A|nr:predicted protein [Histoplasma mississippiense (nom. inval.)]EDN07193.1 predicted protein [Histoplasma mississippiense (nom. inval.)]